VNGKLLKNMGATRIVMINSSGKNKDTTSAVSGSDTFNNVWYRSS
jgi:hypothetical protein